MQNLTFAQASSVRVINLQIVIFYDHTGFLTKDETSETTIQNLLCLSLFIQDSLQL